MLFTNQLKQQNILQDKQNVQANKGDKKCIIGKSGEVMSQSTPDQRIIENYEDQNKMFDSTPFLEHTIPDLNHIANLLKKKSFKKQKTYKNEMIQTQPIKKISQKLCLNCEKFIDSPSIIAHEKQCPNFQQLLSLNRHQLLAHIIAKILTNQHTLSQYRKQNHQKQQILFVEQKIAHLVKMKLRLQSKISNS